ncbi:MAG: UvrD-helicase domain-containing protein, partial [Alloprevotella sp.]
MKLKIYEASAGSGKTYRLALEYIALALQSGVPSDYAHILAVTFTNKATGEMKDRILTQLYNVAKGGLDRGFMNDLLQRMQLPAETVARRAQATLHAMLHGYDRFRVETIDSFFQSLLSNLAHELNLTRGFKVDLDTEEVVGRAVDRMLLSVGRSDKAGQRTARLVGDYMREHIEDDKGWNIAREMKAFAMQNLFRDEYLQNENELDALLHDVATINALKGELRQIVGQARGKLAQASAPLEQLLTSPPDGLDATKLKSHSGLGKLAAALLQGDCTAEPNATMLKAADQADALLNKSLQQDSSYRAYAEEVAQAIAHALQALGQCALPLSTSELMLGKLSPLCLLGAIAREVGCINAESGSFMLAKTPDLFNKMVQKEDASFVFERTGTTFNHIMIDEFQDTSRLQWNNFRRLMLDNMAQGDGCMLVGDVKQSIYRWRGGDWSILGNMGSEMARTGIDIDTEPLDTNYRSQKQVVDFNNSFFDFACKRVDQANQDEGLAHTDELQHIYAHVRQKVKPKAEAGFVRVAVNGKKTTDEEVLEDMAAQIELLADEWGVPYGEMGILVRTKKETQHIIEHFAKQHPQIPLTSDEAFKLTASPAVMLLVHALKYLADPGNTVAREVCMKMGQTLRAPFGREALGQLDSRREMWLKLPLYELCQRLLRLFALPQAEAKGMGQSAYLYAFLDKVLDYVDEHGSDVPDFLEHWEATLCRQSVAVGTNDAVYIMTIHKSKGLQRHTVLLPFCNWKLDRDFPDDMLWCSTAELPEPWNRLPLAPIGCYASKKVKLSAFSPYYRHEHLQQRIDSMNELYVAFTRAEENLLVWCKAEKNTVGELVDAFVNPKRDAPRAQSAASRGQSPAQAKADTVQVYGQLQPFRSKIAAATTDAGCHNPLVPSRIDKVQVNLFDSPTQVVFKQSNRARDFVSELHSESGE